MISLKDLLLYISVFLIGGTVIYGTFFKDSTVVEPDFEEVNRLNAIIVVRTSERDNALKQISQRDSLLKIVNSMEVDKRDTILVALEDVLLGATDAEKDSLINEALNTLE